MIFRSLNVAASALKENKTSGMQYLKSIIKVFNITKNKFTGR